MDLICSVELVQVIWCTFMYLKGKLAMPAEQQLKSRGKVGTINISQLFAAFRELASSTSHGTGSSVVIEAAN